MKINNTPVKLPFPKMNKNIEPLDVKTRKKNLSMLLLFVPLFVFSCSRNPSSDNSHQSTSNETPANSHPSTNSQTAPIQPQESNPVNDKPKFNPNGCDLDVPNALLIAKIEQYGFKFLENDVLPDAKDYDNCSIMYRVVVKRIQNGYEQDGLYRFMPTFKKVGGRFELTDVLLYTYSDGTIRHIM